MIRREVRLRLDDHRLYRVFDSMDISQSVLTSFFARASTGQFDLETPEQLVRLLIQMTRNKLAFQVRRQRARRRDGRLTDARAGRRAGRRRRRRRGRASWRRTTT